MLKFPIETIIFDLDGTLRHNEPSANDTQFNFLVSLGFQNSTKIKNRGGRWVHYYWAQSPELFSDLNTYGEMNDEFWGVYFTRYLQALDVEKGDLLRFASLLSNHMEENYSPRDYIYPCVPETLSTLKSTGYNLGLVSNRSKPCQEQCQALGLLDFFQFAYVAAEVDAWKPDPKIFDLALNVTGSKPQNTLYVGDNFFADVEGATKAGIQPILYDPYEFFPDATCPKINKIKDLVYLLENNHPL